MDELLVTLEKKLGERFPGFVFESGYTDHAYTCGSWILPNQKEGILGAYAKALAAHGQAAMANRLVPGIRFMTSDTGVASAKVSALLIGAQQPIHIGDCIGVDHRNQRKIADFDAEMDKLFAKFCDSVGLHAPLFDHPQLQRGRPRRHAEYGCHIASADGVGDIALGAMHTAFQPAVIAHSGGVAK